MKIEEDILNEIKPNQIRLKSIQFNTIDLKQNRTNYAKFQLNNRKGKLIVLNLN